MSFVDAALPPFLFAAASVGHACLMVRSHNGWYGSFLGKRTVDVIQVLHGLLTLAGPAFLWHLSGFDPRPLLNLPSGPTFGQTLLAGYLVVCWAVTFLVVPVVTFSRLTRRCPALVSEETTTVDVAGLLAQAGRRGEAPAVRVRPL